MKFTDYFEYNDEDSKNEIEFDQGYPGGYMKINLTFIKKIDFVFNVDFLIDSDKIYISVLQRKNRLTKEFVYNYIPKRESKSKLKSIFNRISSMVPSNAYYDVLEDDFFDDIIEEIGGVDVIFRGILKKTFI